MRVHRGGMMGNQVLTAITKPSSFELQNAIFSFSDNAPESSPDDSIKHALAITGEACSLIEAGKSANEVISHFSALGLSEECARPFVEKAKEVVSWNSKLGESVESAPLGGSSMQMLQIVVPIAVAIAVLAYAFIR
jgi:hypothetical protein